MLTLTALPAAGLEAPSTGRVRRLIRRSREGYALAMGMALISLALLAQLGGPAREGAPEAGPPPAVVARVLGVAQDGGVPQANCRCPRCSLARQDPGRVQRVASLALLDAKAASTFIIDATPDFPAQLAALAHDPLLPLPEGRSPLAGILLTHAHVGHYAGLIHLGREVLASRDLAVFATPRMAHFLETNGPWSQLVELGQICLVRARHDRALTLTPGLRATAIAVPHRDEFSDTVAWLVEGPAKSLLWLPDIDKWERWDRSLESLLDEVDYAFLDGTFFSADELPGRSLAEIPHPLVSETRARLEGRPRRARVFLIHLNHSNPLLGPDPEARDRLRSVGIEVADEGLRLGL